MSEARMEADTLWFLDTLVRILIPYERAEDGLSLIESHVRYGDSPPLHVHYEEHELFYILEGEFRFQIGDENFRRHAGQAILAPKGIPHSYRVESPAGGHCTVTMSGGDFEGLVRSIGRPPEHAGLPEPSGPPTPEQVQALAKAALEHRIEVVGPPLA